MDKKLSTYQINDQSYSFDELMDYCQIQSEDNVGWQADNCRFIKEWLSDDDVIRTHTSGSTGEPKMIEMPKAKVEASARLTASYFELRPGAKVLLCLPATYIAGKMVIARALVNSWHLKWTEPASNPLSGIDEDFDFTSFTPMQMSHILKHSADSFRRFRKVLIGGSAVTNVLEQALRSFSNEIYETYGMTETISHVAVRRLNGNSHFFHALPGVRFRKDMTGRLVISAQHLGAEEVVTNDVVSLSGQQSFQFLGRIDNVINSGGIKLFPEKIERSIANLIESDYFLIKEPDLELGERMVMYIESKPYEAQELLRLRSAMKLLLDNYELPKDIRFREKFERTVSGKVIRRLY